MLTSVHNTPLKHIAVSLMYVVIIFIAIEFDLNAVYIYETELRLQRV